MIVEFQDEYRWLSNFTPVEIYLDGYRYSSVEKAYMSAKSDEENWKKLCRNENYSPGKIKRLSKQIEIVDDWEDKKVNVMRFCLEQKFNQEPFKTLLLDTGNKYIQEGNRWGDKFWGVCLNTNEGLNILGMLIMDIRNQIKNK